jgi:hypothetical protein
MLKVFERRWCIGNDVLIRQFNLPCGKMGRRGDNYGWWQLSRQLK